jgi:hypothetical protein
VLGAAGGTNRGADPWTNAILEAALPIFALILIAWSRPI